MIKICNRCKIRKPYDEFYEDKKGSDGYRFECKCCCKQYEKNNAEKIKIRRKKYRQKNREKLLQQTREWKKDNKARVERYYQKNKKKINNYLRKKRNENIEFKLSGSLRRRLTNALKSNQKLGSAVKDLKCTIPFFKSYMKDKFYLHPKTGEQMTWNNWGRGYGKWQIDHIEELHIVNLTKREEFLRVVHYNNLQPLWYCDHILKDKNE